MLLSETDFLSATFLRDSVNLSLTTYPHVSLLAHQFPPTKYFTFFTTQDQVHAGAPYW